MKFFFIVISSLFFLSYNCYCQVAGFTVASTTCINQNLSLSNNSTGSTKYVWDFCQDGLTHVSAVADIATLSSLNIPVGVHLEYDQGQWFGFASGRDGGNKLVQLNFGTDLTNTPTTVNLNSSVSTFTGTSDISFINQGGNWYGFTVDFYTSAMIRLDYGSSLLNTPTSTNLGNLGWNGLYDVAIVKDGTSYFGFVTNYYANTISVLSFGNSVTNTPTVSSFGSALLNNPVKIKILKQNTNWYGLVTSLGNSKVLFLDFGTDVSTVPTVSSCADISGATGLQFLKDGNSIYGFVVGNNGALKRLDFGSSATNTPVLKDVGFPAGSTLVYGLSMIKEWPNWKGAMIEVFTGKTHLLSFSDQCTDANQLSSTSVNPQIQYLTSGSKIIELAAYSSTGTIDTVSHSVTVINQSGPNVSIVTQNMCVNAPVLFSENLISGPTPISSVWDFGDGNSDTQASTSNTYSTATSYTIKLDVTSSNGCTNSITKTLQIFNPPVADFALPSNNPLCTNQQLTFTNSSTSDVGSSPTWQWLVNSTAVSTTKNLSYLFNNTSSQDIKLQSTIPGCSNEITKTINTLLSGPNVDFSAPNGCGNDAVSFTNLTTDPVTGFLWNFGDTQTSTATSVSHAYGSTGPYTVSLQGSSSNGCQNVKSRIVTIYTKPVPDFSLSLPPFSCTGSPSQFNDLTANPVDSNLASWLWSFDDPGSGLNSSAVRNAQHTYSAAGDYNVSLTTKTNFGCQATVVKKVTVSQAPQIAFSNTPACQNQGTNFNDESDNAQSWFWQIESTTYNIKNPIHVFAASGNYAVNLTVTSTNNCISFLSKSVNVPKSLVPDFSFQKNCIDQNTEFVDLTDGSVDPVTTQQWTFGTLGTATGSPAIFTFPSAGAVSTTMQITAQSGCKYSITKSVSIVSAPTALFTANPEAGVPPLDVAFLNNSSNASSYLWTFNDSNNRTSTDVSPSFTFNEIGDHVVDLTAYNNLGCSDTFSKIIKAMLPVYDISLIGFNIIKNDDGSLKLIAALHNEGNVSVNNMSLELSLSGVTSVREAVTETISPQASANHILNYEITDASKLEFLCVTVILANDLSTDNNERCITLDKPYFLYDPYPNPASDLLNINWIADSTEPLSIIIIDALGNQVMTTSLSSEQGLNSVKMLTDGLADGIYAMFLKYGSYKEIKRISIEH